MIQAGKMREIRLTYKNFVRQNFEGLIRKLETNHCDISAFRRLISIIAILFFFFSSSYTFQNYRSHCDLGWLQRACNKTRPALTYSALRGNISADPQRERPWLRNTETQIPRRVRLSLSLSIFIFFFFFLFIAVISPIKVFSNKNTPTYMN